LQLLAAEVAASELYLCFPYLYLDFPRRDANETIDNNKVTVAGRWKDAAASSEVAYNYILNIP